MSSVIDAEISKLNTFKAKKKLVFQKFWIDASEKSNASVEPSNSNEKENSASLESVTSANNDLNEKCSSDTPVTSISTTYATPAQTKIRNEIFVLDADLVALKQRKNCGLINDEMKREFEVKTKKLAALRKEIKKHEREMVRHRKRRLQNKKNIEKACVTNPELKKSLNVRGTVGSPRIEDDQPFLLQTIVDLALHGSAAHERRRDETIRTVTTLDNLVDKLREDYGYNLSRSATYLRLLPRKSNSIQGKRHVNTVPVKLIRPSNDSHKQHVDSKFAMTSINHIDELASLLGPYETTYISQDDKAKIPIGLPAVAKQAPLLIHMEYRYLSVQSICF